MRKRKTKEPLAVLAQPKRKPRPIWSLPLLALAFSLSIADWAKKPLDGMPVGERIHVTKEGRILVIDENVLQVSGDIYYFALDSANGSYAATEATLATSLSARLTVLDADAANVSSSTRNQSRREAANLRRHGSYANVDGANGYAGLKIVGPCYGLNGLSIAAAGLCRDIFNYVCSRNPNYAAPTYRTNQWGDTYPIWGKFLEAPARLLTDGDDRRIAQAKGTYAGATIYVAQTSSGTGDGSSYVNRKEAATVTTASYDLVVWCGDFYRVDGAALVPWYPKTGTAGARTIWVSHSTDRARLLGFRFATATNDGSGTGTYYTGEPLITSNYYVYTLVNDVPTGLTRVTTLADCRTTDNSYFHDSGATRMYIHRADDADPTTTTFFHNGLAVYWNDSSTITPAAGKSYFDYYGLKFFQMRFDSVFHWYASNWRMHACEIWFPAAAGTPFGVTGRSVNINTGQYVETGTNQHRTPDIPDGRELNGCAFYYGNGGFYDTSFLENVPTNTVIRDTYYYANGKNTLGIVVSPPGADGHQIASQGSYNGLLARNVTFEECCPQAVVIYLFDGGHRNRNTTLTDATVTNGTFTTDLAGWTDLSAGGGSVAQSGGKAVFTIGGGTAALEQAVTVGAAYLKKSGASFTISTNVLTLSGSPDLSNLVTSGDNQSFIEVTTRDANGVGRFKITAFDDTAKTVTVTPTPNTLVTSAWKIARAHFVKFTLLPSQSIKVAVRTATGLSGGSAILAATLITANETSGVAAISFEPTVSPYYLQFICESGTSSASLDDVTLPTNLASEPGFATSLPAAKVWFDPIYNFHYVGQRAHNMTFKKLFVHNPDELELGENAPISLTGDITYGYAGQIRGIVIDGCRFESDIADRIAIGVRVKWHLPSPYDSSQISITNCTMRGVTAGIRGVSATPDENGTLTDPSYLASGNDIHATDHFILNQDGNTNRHKYILRNNIYRNNASADWVSNGGTATTLAQWQALSGGSDEYDDTGSTHVVL